MIINKDIQGTNAVFAPVGKLDTATAPLLETAVTDILPAVNTIVFDFKELQYISSAGLRVILKTQKAIASNGSLKITNVNSEIMEIFEMTGFIDILNIE